MAKKSNPFGKANGKPPEEKSKGDNAMKDAFGKAKPFTKVKKGGSKK